MKTALNYGSIPSKLLDSTEERLLCRFVSLKYSPWFWSSDNSLSQVIMCYVLCAKCQVPSVKCQVSSTIFPTPLPKSPIHYVPSAKCQVSSVKCQVQLYQTPAHPNTPLPVPESPSHYVVCVMSYVKTLPNTPSPSPRVSLSPSPLSPSPQVIMSMCQVSSKLLPNTRSPHPKSPSPRVPLTQSPLVSLPPRVPSTQISSKPHTIHL